jgi:hypothetical protein
VAAFLPDALAFSWPAADAQVTAAGPTDDSPNAQVAPCEPVPGPQSAQVWTFNTPAAGYVSNTVTGESTCLNLYGCLPRMIYYQCCIDCGCSNGTGFIFQLQPNGSLTTPLLAGLCAGLLPDGVTVAMVPCAPSVTSQQWVYSAARQLVNGASRSCLTSQLLPVFPYVRVCIRVTAYSGFNGLAPVPGYCLKLDSSGVWAVSAAATVLANGTVIGFDPTARQTLALAATGNTVSASIGGVALGSWLSAAYDAGMVALGSGVHAAAFDDLVVAPA